MLEPIGANEDGTYTYIYLMDPVVSTPGAYAFFPPLSKEYSEEKARAIPVRASDYDTINRNIKIIKKKQIS